MARRTPTTKTVADAINLALRTRWYSQKDGDRTYYRALSIGTLLEPSGLTSPLKTVTYASVHRAWREKAKTGERSADRAAAALSGAFRCALEEGWIDRVPPAHRPRPARGRTFCPSGAEVSLVLNHLSGEDLRLGTFLAETGCRLGEALSKNLRVERERGGPSAGCRWVVIFPETKGGVPRSVLVPAGTPVPPFRTTRSGFGAAWREARKLAGAPPEFVPHSLRHYRITELLRAGVPQHAVQAYVGHRSGRTTERYTHAGEAEQRLVVEATERRPPAACVMGLEPGRRCEWCNAPATVTIDGAHFCSEDHGRAFEAAYVSPRFRRLAPAGPVQ